MPQFATIAAPLTDLTKKGKPDRVQWNATCEGAFQKLKEMLQGPAVVKVAEPDCPFILQTDASDRGLGAVLSQKTADGVEFPVAYASRKLFPREVKYTVIEKECLAIVWSLRVFHTYLYGNTFTVETDHQPRWFCLTRLAVLPFWFGIPARWALFGLFSMRA